MMKNKAGLAIRWFYLAVGVVAMLFAGVLYAWSILKAPLAAEFGWGASALALNFTLAMSFFCIGGLLGAQIAKGAGHRAALLISGGVSALGFALTAVLKSASVGSLYVTYGVLAGLGIGIAYNVVIATVSGWFPDKKGLCLTGMSYGACPTITAAFTSSFFGMKHFSTNMAFMTFTVMGGSLIATLSNKVLELTGTYNATFVMLLALTGVALALNLFIRKP